MALAWFLAVCAIAVAAVLLLASGKPETFTVQRSIAISALPESIAPWIVDFHRWKEWSPWEKLDTDLRKEFSGPDSGPGAKYAWEGRKSGKGSMEVLEVEGAVRISMRVDFEKPFEGHNQILFRLERQAGLTFATWTMTGPNSFFPGRIFQVFVDMDKMIGKTFEEGLSSLKRICEAQPTPPTRETRTDG